MKTMIIKFWIFAALLTVIIVTPFGLMPALENLESWVNAGNEVDNLEKQVKSKASSLTAKVNVYKGISEGNHSDKNFVYNRIYDISNAEVVDIYAISLDENGNEKRVKVTDINKVKNAMYYEYELRSKDLDSVVRKLEESRLLLESLKISYNKGTLVVRVMTGEI